MASNIFSKQVLSVKRSRLAEYLKQNAETLADRADVDIDVHEIETMGGTKSFIATVRVELKDIPLEAVELEAQGGNQEYK